MKSFNIKLLVRNFS